MRGLAEVLPELAPKTERGFGGISYPLFEAVGQRVACIPLFGHGVDDSSEFGPEALEVRLLPHPYELPADLAEMKGVAVSRHQGRSGMLGGSGTFVDGDKCRLANMDLAGDPAKPQCRLSVQPLKYSDYLAANAFLDTDLRGETIRERYTRDLGRREGLPVDPSKLALSNIMGAGVFYLTTDHQLVLSKRSSSVAVFPNTVGFTASGSCDWHDFVSGDPAQGFFRAIQRECREELGDEPDLEALRCFAAAVDVEQFYFQFSFVHRTGLSAEELGQRHSTAPDRAEQSLFCVDRDDQGALEDLLATRQFEPTAEFALRCWLTVNRGAHFMQNPETEPRPRGSVDVPGALPEG